MNEYVSHPQRIDLHAAAPDAYRAMTEFNRTVKLDPVLAELIKIRASQINGCAYCVDLHVRTAREAGENPQRLDTIAVWRDSPFFTARERAALALTEAMTRIAEDPLDDEVFTEAEHHFDHVELSQLVMAVVAINAWNMISVTARRPPRAR